MGREVKHWKKGPRKGWQMWQTVSDEAYTPIFATPEELAQHCAANPWGAERDNPVSYGTWLAFINGPGWAPSMASVGGRAVSGVEFMTAPTASGNSADARSDNEGEVS